MPEPTVPALSPTGARPRLLAALPLGALLLGALSACGPSSHPTTDLTRGGTGGREQTADQQVHHVLSRLAFGPRPGDVEAVRAMGVDAWVDRQLHPERIDDRATERFVAQFPTLGRAGGDLLAEYPPPGMVAQQLAKRGGMLTAADSALIKEESRKAYFVTGELATAQVARAVISDRQLEESMVEFWENHFSVFAGKDRIRYFLPEYDEKVIRPHALGRFRDLLGAVAKSPAMLMYLDNFQSVADSGRPVLRPVAALAAARRAAANPRPAARPATAPATSPASSGTSGTSATSPTTPARPAIAALAARRRGLNENYARELMELHTLGVDGGYTQQDVIEVARALTGWTLERGAQGGEFIFRPAVHDAGAKIILGNKFPAGHGEDEGERVLDILARHPRTAEFIATKLARRFVSDSPPPALIRRAAATFQRTDGDIREVMRTIVTSPEFFSAAAYRAKVKSPFELVVSALRAVNARPDSTPRTAQLIGRLGQPIFGHLAPNGYPESGDAWMNTGAILNRINFGLSLAGGRVPGVKLADWPASQQLAMLPREQQVDGVIRDLLGGDVSTDTRQVLLTGTNLFLERHAADTTAVADASDTSGLMTGGTNTSTDATRMRGDTAKTMTTAVADERRRQAQERRAERLPLKDQQQRAGLEIAKPSKAGSLTQALGSVPPAVGLPQIVGLALGAPEFQRR